MRLTYRLPYPNAHVYGSVVGCSMSRSRSGINSEGGYFAFGSNAICLWSPCNLDTRVRKGRKERGIPRIRHHDCTLRDKISLIEIVFRRAPCDTEGKHRPPPNNFLHHCLHIRHPSVICHTGQALRTNYAVKFCLCAVQDGRVQRHGDEEYKCRSECLLGCQRIPGRMVEKRTVSAPAVSKEMA